MALNDLIRSGVAIAAKITAPLQVTVQHAAWDGTQSATGVPNRATAVARTALVEPTRRRVIGPDGQEHQAAHRILFLEPLAVTVQDAITLPDGSAPPIFAVSGPPLDPVDGLPPITEVLCG